LHQLHYLCFELQKLTAEQQNSFPSFNDQGPGVLTHTKSGQGANKLNEQHFTLVVLLKNPKTKFNCKQTQIVTVKIKKNFLYTVHLYKCYQNTTQKLQNFMLLS